jgi:hypothetical protein
MQDVESDAPIKTTKLPNFKKVSKSSKDACEVPWLDIAQGYELIAFSPHDTCIAYHSYGGYTAFHAC